MNVFIILLCVFIVVWIAVYLRTQTTTIEHFDTTIPSRKCAVWFTDDFTGCDEGLYHKDIRSIEYLRDSLVGRSEVQLSNDLKKLEENKVIIDNYDNMTTRAIEDKIFQTSSAIIARENANLTNRREDLVVYHTRFLNNRTQYAQYYSNIIPRLKAENQILTNRINSARGNISNIKSSPEYKRINTALQIKTQNPNFRCKNELHGWNEFNSGSDPANNDPNKKISSSTRGDPYTWATCSKVFPSDAAKSQEQSYIENKKLEYPDIEIDSRPINGLTNEQNAVTAQIRFNRFNQNDIFECDDRITTPAMPVIPNGLFEMTINNTDIIQKMRVTKYADDSRYIDPQQTKDITQISGDKIQEIFFDMIYEIWPTQQLYIYPKKGTDIEYRVHYIYYDNKCKRFLPNTTKPLGVSVAGDIMRRESPHVIHKNINDLLGRYIGNVPAILTQRRSNSRNTTRENIRYYINTRNVTGLSIFNNIRTKIQLDIDNLTNIIQKNRNKVSLEESKRDKLYKLYNNNKIWSYYLFKRKVNFKKLYAIRVSLKITGDKHNRNVKTLLNTINNVLDPQLNNLRSIQTSFNNYITELDTAAKAFNVNILKTKIESYLGKNIREFIGKYNPGYISNNSTIFLQITSFSKATNEYYSFDNIANRISSIQQDPTVNYNAEEETTTYETVFTEDSVDPNSFLYIPTVNTELLQVNNNPYVILYNIAKNQVRDFIEEGTINISVNNTINTPIMYIDIAPGIRIDIQNGAGVTNSFDNSSNATTYKQVELNSSMTGGCEESDRCLMTSITITKL